MRVERRGEAAHLLAANPRYLNAEDGTTLDAMEIAVDVAILDPATKAAVVRGGAVDHPKYRGQRIFGAGINLTHLYRGEFLRLVPAARPRLRAQDLPRCRAPSILPDDVTHRASRSRGSPRSIISPSAATARRLVMDYVVASDDAYMTLPARKEGIIPGAANLRLPRFVGDRLARQLIQHERKLVCDSPEGRLICDEIAPALGIDAAVDRVVAGLTSFGAAGAIANRRALRAGLEPLDLYRRYMAAYAREQAFCHFSPALIANLERYWDAQNRGG